MVCSWSFGGFFFKPWLAHTPGGTRWGLPARVKKMLVTFKLWHQARRHLSSNVILKTVPFLTSGGCCFFCTILLRFRMAPHRGDFPRSIHGSVYRSYIYFTVIFILRFVLQSVKINLCLSFFFKKSFGFDGMFAESWPSEKSQPKSLGHFLARLQLGSTQQHSFGSLT